MALYDYDYPTPKPQSGPGPSLMGSLSTMGMGTMGNGSLGSMASNVWGGLKDAASQFASSRPPVPLGASTPVAPPTPAGPATQSQVRAVDNTGANAQAIANTYANAGNGADMTVPESAAFGGGRVQQPGSLGVVGDSGKTDTMGQLQRDIAHYQGLSQMRNTSDPTPGVGIMDDRDSTQKFFDEANLRNAAARTTFSPRKGYSGDAGAVAAAAIPIQNRTRLQEMNLKNIADQNVANIQANTQRRGQDMLAATARDEHDVQRRGQDYSARTAAAQARMEQMNKDRQYNLDVAKYGTDMAEKNRTAREADEKAMNDQLGAAFRTKDADGKDVADTAKIGQFKTALNSTLGNIIDQHMASGDPQRMALAKNLQERGWAAVDPAERQQLMDLFNTRERMRQSRGIGPNSGTFRDSENLLDYAQAPGLAGIDRRTFGGDRLVTRGGGSVSLNDLRYKDGPANSIFPDWFKVQSPDLVRNLKGF